MLKPELTVFSDGLGQDSKAILVLLRHSLPFRKHFAPNRLIVINSDTGNEHSHTYAELPEHRRLCREIGAEFHLISPSLGYHTGTWLSLSHFYRTHNTCGSKAFPKTCTDRLKIQPIYSFLEDWIQINYGFTSHNKKALRNFALYHGKIQVLLGISAEEGGRIASDESLKVWQRKSLRRVYPLVELGIDRREAQRIIASYGYEVPYPSNCRKCPYKSKQELLWTYRFDRAMYEEWVEDEARKISANLHLGERNLGVFGKKLLPQVLRESIVEFGHWSDSQLDDYYFSHGHCVRSAY